MIRHIVVEGPDGSGKDGLIARLSTVFASEGYRVHERASTSVGGPVPDLRTWTERDMATLDTSSPWIYNRHPLISEPLYAPIVRKCEPQYPFGDLEWVAMASRQLCRTTIVVWCLPGIDTCLQNVIMNSGDQMPGVRENTPALYSAYLNAKATWPGYDTIWDYNHSRFEDVVRDIMEFRIRGTWPPVGHRPIESYI